MDTIRELMVELDGADPETVHRIAWERGSLPVRLAMLGLASLRKGESPLWWGYPPGVFISYKWEGEAMRGLVADFAAHVRSLGYRAFLDVEKLDSDADAYFQIPQFITALQDCTFYLLLLTKQSVRLMTASDGKTSWIHDEFQHAVRLVNAGRLIMVPVLLEPGALPEFLAPEQVLDVTREPRALERLNGILTPAPLGLEEGEARELAAVAAEFDRLFLSQAWAESKHALERSTRFRNAFDHQLRRMLHGLYTADEAAFRSAFDEMCNVYGERLVLHIYAGYCARHGIPVRLSAG